MSLLFRPVDGVAADFIPFCWKGEYHLFYLKDHRDPAKYGRGTPWFHLSTHDFVHFDDWGEALPRGALDAQDLWVFTGSVVEKGGTFRIFYTGHNELFRDAGKPIQAIMRASSPDLRTWTKDETFIFFAPEGYEQDDWRDPFVFWNDEAGEYWMLLAARKHEGPSRNRGCIALATSSDLEDWEVRPPFWTPNLYHTHECPDLFRIGDWWYLVYSTYSERCVTHYRMSQSLSGPWLAPANDSFDARAYYAAKTAGDSDRRFAFGWLPTRINEKDDGSWQWGGNLVVHEIVQERDGALSMRMPGTVRQAFTRTAPITPQPVLGEWTVENTRISAAAVSRFSTLNLGDLPDECLVEAEVTLTPGTVNAGLILRADAELDRYYQVRLEPPNGRMVFDRWPRPGDQPFMLERPMSFTPVEPVRLRVLLDGTCAVVYADDRVACSCRMYEQRTGGLGLFVTEGEATFANVTVFVRG